MADWCARQERAAYDVRQKLKSIGLDEDGCEEIVKKLIEEKYVDDQRYSRFFVKDKFKFNGWGRIKIRYQLVQKKIDNNLIEEAMDEINEEEYEEKLTHLLKNKHKSIKNKDLWQSRAALFRFAQSRGYENEPTNRIISKIIE